jgi:hypothetical protein
MPIRVTCINKDSGHHEDPHMGITNFGWIEDLSSNSGNYTRLQMIKFLEARGSAYVKDSLGNKADLIVVSRNGSKYVKTVADGKYTDNLLKLKECPL